MSQFIQLLIISTSVCFIAIGCKESEAPKLPDANSFAGDLNQGGFGTGQTTDPNNPFGTPQINAGTQVGSTVDPFGSQSSISQPSVSAGSTIADNSPFSSSTSEPSTPFSAAESTDIQQTSKVNACNAQGRQYDLSTSTCTNFLINKFPCTKAGISDAFKAVGFTVPDSVYSGYDLKASNVANACGSMSNGQSSKLMVLLTKVVTNNQMPELTVRKIAN